MLNRTTYFIREHVGLLKLTDTYDILDPETREKIGEAKEDVGGLTKFLRLFINKALMPTAINVYEQGPDGGRELLFTIRRGFTFLRPRVNIIGGDGTPLGYFKSKLFSVGGAFGVFSPDDQQVALIQGNWIGWNFRFLSGDRELGSVTKKWAGMGKELFTSADNYVIDIREADNPSLNLLLLAAGLAIDTVLKERR